MSPKFQISRDSQALYITIVTKDRLPVFQTDAIRLVTCQALDEARKSGGFLLFAYVIMPDHLHLLTDCPKTSADVLRCVKGITARRVIDLSERARLPEFTGEITTPRVEAQTQLLTLATGEECLLRFQ
jgi:REP element-mobilizing transposase RayT